MKLSSDVLLYVLSLWLMMAGLFFAGGLAGALAFRRLGRRQVREGGRDVTGSS
jgi:hypothetical protein